MYVHNRRFRHAANIAFVPDVELDTSSNFREIHDERFQVEVNKAADEYAEKAGNRAKIEQDQFVWRYFARSNMNYVVTGPHTVL